MNVAKAIRRNGTAMRVFTRAEARPVASPSRGTVRKELGSRTVKTNTPATAKNDVVTRYTKSEERGAMYVVPNRIAARYHGRYGLGENHAATTTTTKITAVSKGLGDMAGDERTSRGSPPV